MTVPIAHLTLELEAHKPMSLAFIYRLISSLTQAKAASDVQARNEMLARMRKAAPDSDGSMMPALLTDEVAVDMPAFVVARIFETYGVPSIAKRYLCEVRPPPLPAAGLRGKVRAILPHMRNTLLARHSLTLPKSVRS